MHEIRSQVLRISGDSIGYYLNRVLSLVMFNASLAVPRQLSEHVNHLPRQPLAA